MALKQPPKNHLEDLSAAPDTEFADSLAATVDALRELCAEDGLRGPQIDSKLHRMRVLAGILDENPNQPALQNVFRSIEQDIERLLPVQPDTAFEDLMAELNQMAADSAQKESDR